MKFEGQAIHCSTIEDNIVELQFNLENDSVNKFNAITLKELRQAVDLIKSAPNLKGLLLSSRKDCFIVGADVTEFLTHFKKSDPELASWVKGTNDLFCEIEDLKVPSVSAINGYALGGGFEVTLATTYRVLSSEAKVGLPETKLGIFPGWGGTVRLSRLIGADNAIEWIASGKQWNAGDALKVGAVDAVVSPDQVRNSSLNLLKDAIQGKLDWKAKREERLRPLHLNRVESTMVFEGAKAFVGAKAGPHYPAPISAIEVMQLGATKSRNEALAIESEAFCKIVRSPVAHALVTLFLNDQLIKRKSKKITQKAEIAETPIKTAAVLGAGIMGGGIAYESASCGVPIYMKDISDHAIQLGLTEANKLLDKKVNQKRITSSQMGEVLSKIRPVLSYGDFKQVDFIVEAVVENEKVKKMVLAETESSVKEDTVLASNTSTISITRLAESLKRPENFCGMHFFNPVHKMPLVEVIRGKKSSEKAIATTVAYALKMGKTPIVVNDCAGFFVNRVLFPYIGGFLKLLNDGVDFQRIDKVMEKFGWPMGPAFLLDVVGIDTANHANSIMAEAYPDRMKSPDKHAISVLFEAKRFGQKNGNGFYRYLPDKKGHPKKEVDPQTYELLNSAGLKSFSTGGSEVSDTEIVERMMLPLIIESSRCLEEEIISSPTEIDIGLIYGLGFPPFRGGVMRYAESLGLKNICQIAKKYTALGKLYEPTAQMHQLAQSGQLFYQ